MPDSREARPLKWAEIQEVFESWKPQAIREGGKALIVWNQLLNDLRMKAESHD